MGTIWESNKKATNNNTFTGTTLSTWSCQQKLAMIAGFAILGLLLAVSACSKQSPKPALVGVSSPDANAPLTPSAGAPQTPAPQAATTTPPTAAKKAKKRPANVTYSDANSGVSFVYPRKFALSTGDKAQPKFDNDAVPMNFVQAGGVAVAMVSLPKALYPGTDYDSAFFSVNVNRGLSEQECSQFKFVDTHNTDGKPVESERVKVGSIDMATTSEFESGATKQAEAQYYHNYENGACYEFVLGLGTTASGAKDGIEPVNRDEVFTRLEKILETVKLNPAAKEQFAQEKASAPTVATAEPVK